MADSNLNSEDSLGPMPGEHAVDVPVEDRVYGESVTKTIEDNLAELQDALDGPIQPATPEVPEAATPTAADFLALAGGSYNHAIKSKGGGNVKAWLDAAVGFAKVSGDLLESELYLTANKVMRNG